MNANSVWVGHEYAHVQIVRRRHFPSHASRVKVLNLREVQAWGKQRKDTFAQVEFLDKETGARTGTIREVNVRNLYDFWDSYMDERQAILGKREQEAREREEHQAKLREIAERQARERAEEAEREKQRKEQIANALAYKLGLDTSAVLVWGIDVRIAIKDLEFLVDA